MQNIVSSCATRQIAGFVSSPANNTTKWVSFSAIQATNTKSFGQSTMGTSQQIISVGASGSAVYYYIKGPFAASDFGNLKKSAIHSSQVPAAIASAIAATGSSGYANMLTITTPSSSAKGKKPSPVPTFNGSVSLGISLQSLLMPVCGGSPNWLSIGVYAVIILILIWWFWLRKRA